MKKELIHFDKRTFDHHMSMIGHVIRELQPFADDFAALSIGEINNADEFRDMMQDPERFVFAKMGVEGGMTGEKMSKAIDLLDKDSGVKGFVGKVRAYEIKEYNIFMKVSFKEGNVFYSEEDIQKKRDSCSHFANTEKELARLKDARSLCDVLNGIYERSGQTPLDIEPKTLLEKVLERDGEKLRPKVSFVK